VILLKNNQLFKVVNAKSSGFDSYEKGKIPFITNGFENNGFLGFVKSKLQDRVFTEDSVSVSAFCEATIQKAPFLARGNGGSGLKILVPQKKLGITDLLLVASYINRTQKWKYGFGRMITKDRLKKICQTIDLEKLKTKLSRQFNVESLLPKPIKSDSISHNKRWKEFSLEDLFEDITDGDYHVSSILDEGKTPFISCNTTDNGIAGYFKLPNLKTYEKCMTITSDGEYTFTPFYHPYKFNAQDNVLICKPKKSISLPIIFFVMLQLRRMRWRFSYGRKCYSNKIGKIKFKLPVTENDIINEKYIEKIVRNCYGWNLISNHFN